MSNTDLVLALIKCGKVVNSATTPDQRDMARVYKSLTSKFFHRGIRKGRKIKVGRVNRFYSYNERSLVAQEMLDKLESGEYK